MKKKSISLLLIMLLLSFFSITNAFCLTFYVDTSTGKDNPSWGVKPKKPWKTISYAIQQTSIIEAYEEVLINVAAGTYNENITIDKRSVSIVGSGAATIIDGNDQDVITIDGVHKVVISGILVQNGNRGIIGKSGSSFEVKSTDVQNCADDCIQVVDNSTARIINCTVSGSGRYGLGIYNTSSATITGTLICTFSDLDGLIISESSSAYINDANVTTNNNSLHGIQIAGSSALFSYDSTIFSHNNARDGIQTMEVSSLNLFNSNVTASDNGRNGISIHLNSNGKFTGGVGSHGNTGDGLSIRDNSMLLSTALAINSNTENGISVDNGSSINCCNSNISGNTGYDLFLTFSSRANLFNNTIVDITTDVTSQTRNINLCYP